MILAVLEKRAGLRLGQYDVFVNVAGGVRIDEPAADLGMAIAIASSLRDTPVRADAAIIGEIGLGGEIRSIHQMEKRLAEARKLGFACCVVPCRNTQNARVAPGITLIEVDTITAALSVLLGNGGGHDADADPAPCDHDHGSAGLRSSGTARSRSKAPTITGVLTAEDLAGMPQEGRTVVHAPDTDRDPRVRANAYSSLSDALSRTRGGHAVAGLAPASHLPV
ncbi:MAG: hypothetical protein MZV64_49150 [Ignavibacteriales bacterium]|nr:hypothetical protein [Ignavibacteriales bacterium]